MTQTRTRGHRAATAGVLAVAGGALAIATWVGGERWLALVVAALYVVLAVAAFVWAGRDGDVAAILRAGGDERQRGLDREATALAGLAMMALAIVGAIVSAAHNHGDIGVYGLFAAVGAVAYVVALGLLRRQR